MPPYLLAALVYGLSGGLMPGPLLTFVITQTLRHGAREGVKVACVPMLTDSPIIALLLLALPHVTRWRPVLGVLGICGALYLGWLAVESWRSKMPEASGPVTAPRSILRGVAVNLLNPNPWVFWITVGMPSLAKAWAHGWGAAAAFIALFFGSLCGSKAALAVLIARSREHVAGRWYLPAMRILGLMLLVFAGLMVRDAWRLLR